MRRRRGRRGRQGRQGLWVFSFSQPERRLARLGTVSLP